MKQYLLIEVLQKAKKKNEQKKYKNKHNGQINKLTNKKQTNKQLHCAYYSRMNSISVFHYPFKLIIGTKKTKKINK